MASNDTCLHEIPGCPGCLCVLEPNHKGSCSMHKPEPVVLGGANRGRILGADANWFSVDYETVRGIAETCFEGDNRYGMGNWEKGLPASNLANHAFEHLFKMNSGDSSEPHLEHAIWNLGKLLWMAKHKPDMIDVPAYRRYFGLPPLDPK